MAEEMGKPIRDGIAEIQKCAGGCDYYAENAERFLAPEPCHAPRACAAANGGLTENKNRDPTVRCWPHRVH